jgi:hypothetical protein
MTRTVNGELELLDTDLQALLGGARLAAVVDGAKAAIACGDSARECDTLFSEVDFSDGAVLVSPLREVIQRLLSGQIGQMGAYVYDRDRNVLGNICIRMVLTDPTPEKLLADGYESLNRIFSIATGQA